MTTCPECGMPQYCPCGHCIEIHGKSAPFLWVAAVDTWACGYCGSNINDDTEWDRILDRGLDQFYEETR